MNGHDARVGGESLRPDPGLSGSGRPRAAMPSAGRIYDALLHGRDHYSGDTDLATRLTAHFPQVETSAQAARDFVRRAVTYLAGQGFEQFLDIGAGMPGPSHISEILRGNASRARLVAVDNDPVAVRHGHALMVSRDPRNTAFLQADLREPAAILHQVSTSVLDLRRPVVLVLGAVLHFVEDAQDPAGIMRTLLGALAPGSVLVISHATGDVEPQDAAAAMELYNQLCPDPLTLRSRDGICALVPDVRWIGPGLVQANAWIPESAEALAVDRTVWIYGGVGVLSQPSVGAATGGRVER